MAPVEGGSLEQGWAVIRDITGISVTPSEIGLGASTGLMSLITLLVFRKSKRNDSEWKTWDREQQARLDDAWDHLHRQQSDLMTFLFTFPRTTNGSTPPETREVREVLLTPYSGEQPCSGIGSPRGLPVGPPTS